MGRIELKDVNVTFSLRKTTKVTLKEYLLKGLFLTTVKKLNPAVVCIKRKSGRLQITICKAVNSILRYWNLKVLLIESDPLVAILSIPLHRHKKAKNNSE